MEIHDCLHDVETEKYLYIPTRILQSIIVFLVFIIVISLYFFDNLKFLQTISIILLILSPIIFKITAFATFGTMWDDLDYSGLIKKDISIVKKDGKKMFGYLYIPDGLDIHSGNKYPVLIGVHGYGSHHRVMDRYCLPTIVKEKYLYFTFDAMGHGRNRKIGKIFDFSAFDELKDFIEEIKQQQFVDLKRIAVLGMSFGAAKVSVIAYPDPDIKLLLLLSGVFDMNLNRREAGILAHIQLFISGFRWKHPLDYYDKFSGYYYFKEEGIVLTEHQTPTSNNNRMVLFANRDDPQVSIENTLNAIKKLNLRPTNYRIFPKGGHYFKGNEFYLSIEIHEFLKNNL